MYSYIYIYIEKDRYLRPLRDKSNKCVNKILQGMRIEIAKHQEAVPINYATAHVQPMRSFRIPTAAMLCFMLAANS